MSKPPRPRLRTWVKRLGILSVVVLVAIAAPILWVELGCQSSRQPDRAPFKSALAPADHRDEINSYLTYPEWSIVHAYEDLAGVMRRGSESDYPYWRAITGYWSSLCSITSLASSRGTISTEYKVMLYVIGISFAAEMGVKGLYEKTLGRIAVLIRGPAPTAEDAFALEVADDYAAFLRQTPWYEYPFAATLSRFWRETPMSGPGIVRKIERRIALSMEWGVKVVYAKLIGMGAAAAPAPLRIRSVVVGLTDDDLPADPRIQLIARTPDGGAIVETPRYKEFNEIARKLAIAGRDFREIAGNDDIMVTVLLPPDSRPLPMDQRQILSVPVEARPGWRRVALDVKVSALMTLMRRLEGSGIVFEHAYDY